ncbi:MAG: STAS domain-containing protein [Isosphaeraceae bacterium]
MDPRSARATRRVVQPLLPAIERLTSTRFIPLDNSIPAANAFYPSRNRVFNAADLSMLKPSVQIHNIDGVLVAEFWDCLRLDPAPVQALRGLYEDHLRRGGRPELVVDLLGVGFAGSAALGHFVALQRVARPKNGRLIFCNIDPTVYEVFRATKLESLFTFVSDREAALTFVKTGGSTPAPTDRADTATSPVPGDAPTTPPPPRNSGGAGLLRSSRRRKLS